MVHDDRVTDVIALELANLAVGDWLGRAVVQARDRHVRTGAATDAGSGGGHWRTPATED